MRPARPRVLVTAASRHGSTQDIADALARWLQQSAAAGDRALSAGALHAENRPDPAAYDAARLTASLAPRGHRVFPSGGWSRRC